MIHSPPAVPASQNAAQLAGSKGTPNQNYVRVTNGNTLNDKPVVHRKRAIHLVKCGRAEWIVVDRQIKLIAHSQTAHSRPKQAMVTTRPANSSRTAAKVTVSPCTRRGARPGASARLSAGRRLYEPPSLVDYP